FWLALLVCFWVLFSMTPATPGIAANEPGPRMLSQSEQPEAVRAVMRVDVATERPDGTRTFRGRLYQSAEAAYARLRAESPTNVVPLLQEDETEPAAILLVPRAVEGETLQRPVRPWIHWVLFGL